MTLMRDKIQELWDLSPAQRNALADFLITHHFGRGAYTLALARCELYLAIIAGLPSPAARREALTRLWVNAGFSPSYIRSNIALVYLIGALLGLAFPHDFQIQVKSVLVAGLRKAHKYSASTYETWMAMTAPWNDKQKRDLRKTRYLVALEKLRARMLNLAEWPECEWPWQQPQILGPYPDKSEMNTLYALYRINHENGYLGASRAAQRSGLEDTFLKTFRLPRRDSELYAEDGTGFQPDNVVAEIQTLSDMAPTPPAAPAEEHHADDFTLVASEPARVEQTVGAAAERIADVDLHPTPETKPITFDTFRRQARVDLPVTMRQEVARLKLSGGDSAVIAWMGDNLLPLVLQEAAKSIEFRDPARQAEPA